MMLPHPSWCIRLVAPFPLRRHTLSRSDLLRQYLPPMCLLVESSCALGGDGLRSMACSGTTRSLRCRKRRRHSCRTFSPRFRASDRSTHRSHHNSFNPAARSTHRSHHNSPNPATPQLGRPTAATTAAASAPQLRGSQALRPPLSLPRIACCCPVPLERGPEPVGRFRMAPLQRRVLGSMPRLHGRGNVGMSRLRLS